MRFVNSISGIGMCVLALTADVTSLGASIENRSTSTLCAEEDNINWTLSGTTGRFLLRATHPTYAVTTHYCPTDFRNCPPPSGNDYPFDPAALKLYDDGVWVVWAYRDATWWRPHGMMASCVGGPSLVDAHRIAVSKKITGENSWPQFLVIYQDGNLRLIPHPPVGASSVCFGASVIVGPAEPAQRPLAEIATISFDRADKTLLITYVTGGSARLSMSVDRTEGRVLARVSYPTALPFATFRSMYVSETNCDTAWLAMSRRRALVADVPVLDGTGLQEADEFFFYRKITSSHNTSAPDITILIDTDGDSVFDRDDNCPLVANADQADTDADGVGNACDACPDTPRGRIVGPNGCAPGDCDADADVDLTDFLHFQACFNGPNRPATQLGCADADFDDDADVDLADFMVFQACFNGPNRPPACGPLIKNTQFDINRLDGTAALYRHTSHQLRATAVAIWKNQATCDVPSGQRNEGERLQSARNLATAAWPSAPFPGGSSRVRIPMVA